MCSQFVLSDAQLARELDRMTDHHTQALFGALAAPAQTVRAPVSRLVVDVERFASDDDEAMAARGMGAVYTTASDLQPLRRPLSAVEHENLMRTYYWPHHERFDAAVNEALVQHGRCLVIDGHSFAAQALPYEGAAPGSVRPDICIGTDAFHTPEGMARAFVSEFERTRWRVMVNEPFSGAIVPLSRYRRDRRDRRVASVMVEVNRSLYLCEPGAQPLLGFTQIAEQVSQCCLKAIDACGWASSA
ncbi:putative N-formylglutamate aminohydrolase [Polaromonas sp. CG9_12]|nr:putative N-formylglutamate aminohydrolase [Polaromonas sp. CG9_12]